MCLIRLKKFPCASWAVYYKVFVRRDGRLYSLFGSTEQIIPGQWLWEKAYRHVYHKGDTFIETNWHERYPFGWHVFLLPEDAIAYANGAGTKSGDGIRICAWA